MTDQHSNALLLASRLLAYPDQDFIAELPELRDTAASLSIDAYGARFASVAFAFIDDMLGRPLSECASQYVSIFDFTAQGSLYMSWHRYGNDRSQGKAMAALNGLYRAAGFEPEPGEMPDYLPRMLEFLAIAPAWACETLLDGFGAEIGHLLKTLQDLGAPQYDFLAIAMEPLIHEYPDYFKARTGHDPTRRPMANPSPEPFGPLLPSSDSQSAN